MAEAKGQGVLYGAEGGGEGLGLSYSSALTRGLSFPPPEPLVTARGSEAEGKAEGQLEKR